MVWMYKSEKAMSYIFSQQIMENEILYFCL